jgi:hypothetical protein
VVKNYSGKVLRRQKKEEKAAGFRQIYGPSESTSSCDISLRNCIIWLLSTTLFKEKRVMVPNKIAKKSNLSPERSI